MSSHIFSARLLLIDFFTPCNWFSIFYCLCEVCVQETLLTRYVCATVDQFYVFISLCDSVVNQWPLHCASNAISRVHHRFLDTLYIRLSQCSLVHSKDTLFSVRRVSRYFMRSMTLKHPAGFWLFFRALDFFWHHAALRVFLNRYLVTRLIFKMCLSVWQHEKGQQHVSTKPQSSK